MRRTRERQDFMKRWPVLMLVLAVSLGVAPSAAALPLSSALGALPSSPATVSLAEGTSVAYKADLQAGERLVLSLSPASGEPAELDFDLYVYGPSATVTDHALAVAKSDNPVTLDPESITYQAPSSGTYYVEVFAFDGTGNGVLVWSIQPEPQLPVYRFFNVRTGTHFYTPDEAEKATIVSTLGNVFSYEGVAYSTKATRNDQYLHRFFNKRTGTHFYTADESEKARIINTLGFLYSYDGPTFKVSLTSAGGKAPVYRFYNPRSGTHFYTADEAEKARVQSTLGHVYGFEGTAFYLGQ